jgi:hypothetical protein
MTIGKVMNLFAACLVRLFVQSEQGGGFISPGDHPAEPVDRGWSLY